MITMTAILLCLALAAPCSADDTIRFPEPPSPEQSESAPREIGQLSEEEWYVISSDEPILVISSPQDAVSIEYIQDMATLRGRFVDGVGIETRKISGSHNYVLSANIVGTAEIIVIKTLDQGAVIRRTLELVKKSDPDPIVDPVPKDDVARAFDEYEHEWRTAQKQLSERLLRGDIQTESDAADWISFALVEARKRVFRPLLLQEANVFGGELWTPQRHASYIMRYVDE